MILIKAIILFLITLIPGLAIRRYAGFDKANFKFILIFSGAFLLSISILHLFPELYEHSESDLTISIIILAGIFLQMTLESFTSGIEHGHWHKHSDTSHSPAFPYGLTLALCIHSLLEGAILATDGMSHGHGFFDSLLIGVAIHKIPAAIALMSVLVSEMKNRNTALIILAVFAISSPIGMILSEFLQEQQLLLRESYQIILALSAGSFIYISTTILFEARQNHEIRLAQLIPALLGAAVGILLEGFAFH